MARVPFSLVLWCVVSWCAGLFGVALCRIVACWLHCALVLLAAPPALRLLLQVLCDDLWHVVFLW